MGDCKCTSLFEHDFTIFWCTWHHSIASTRTIKFTWSSVVSVCRMRFYERSMSSRWYIALLYCRNEAEYPRLNLQRWLGLSFVLPPSSDMAQHTTEQNRECPICYAYLVNDVWEITVVFAWFYKRYYCARECMFQIAPDIVCANRQCRRNFHQHCLYIWLKSVPTSRQSFCTVFGICPFCSAPIRCNQVSDITVK